VLSIVSTGLIYYIQKDKYNRQVVNDITKHILSGLENDNINLTDAKFIKYIKLINFVTFELYNENQNKLYSFMKDIKKYTEVSKSKNII